MKLHNLSKIFLTVVATDQNSQKIVFRIDTAPSFLLWRIKIRYFSNTPVSADLQVNRTVTTYDLSSMIGYLYK